MEIVINPASVPTWVDHAVREWKANGNLIRDLAGAAGISPRTLHDIRTNPARWRTGLVVLKAAGYTAETLVRLKP